MGGSKFVWPNGPMADPKITVLVVNYGISNTIVLEIP